MKVSTVFQTFSRRQRAATVPKALTPAFRNRVLMRCRDSFGPSGGLESFWLQIHSKLSYLHGSPSLGGNPLAGRNNLIQDVLTFLTSCSDEHFLDFVEFIFTLDAAQRLVDRDDFIEDINRFLRVDDLPYSLTGYVWTKTKSHMFGGEYDAMELTSYPQVIRRDSEVVHVTAMEPVLQLLREERFKTANTELLNALADYRHGRYGDCLTKAGSAFESVLKVICATRAWPYHENDTAAPLLKTVISEASLEPFWEQPLLVLATLRNRLSTAHGGGSSPRAVSASKAQYALNATASAILFLVREAG